jgi:putative phosphoribosyl transferase
MSGSAGPTQVLEDRAEAGRLLADRLRGLRGEETVVLALPRGGVPVAYEIARRLGAPLDVLIVRKVGDPENPEYGLGAVAEGEIRVLDEARIRAAGYRPEDLEPTIARETAELARRASAYRGSRAAVPVEGRTAVLVDDGVATGATLEAAIRSVRLRRPRRVLVALGVGPADTVERLRTLADGVEVLLVPPLFFAVGEWYRVFDQVSDATVRRLLASDPIPPDPPAGRRPPRGRSRNLRVHVRH